MDNCSCSGKESIDCAANQDWSCGLDAAVAAARTVAPRLSDAWIRSVAAQLGVKPHAFGLSSPEIAVILAEAGFTVSLRSGSLWLSALSRDVKWQGVEHFCTNNPSVAAITAMRRLARLGADLRFGKSGTWDEVLAALTSATAAAIVCVSARAYYRINELWNHYVVIVGTDGEFRVVDRFADIGEHWYPDWKRYASNGSSYDWTAWHGDLLIVR